MDPSQTVVKEGLTETAGRGSAVAATVAVETQPNADVPVTVYVVFAAGKKVVIGDVKLKVFQR